MFDDAWRDAFEDAATEVLELFPDLDRDRVLELIEEAHTRDDPDWEFDGDRLTVHMLAGVDWTDEQFETVRDLFPVGPL